MNQQPISSAHDADLRVSEDALHRAAKRARTIAHQTKTQLVYCYQGEVLRISPEDQGEVEAAWVTEISRRAELYRQGEATTYSAEEVFKTYKKPA